MTVAPPSDSPAAPPATDAPAAAEGASATPATPAEAAPAVSKEDAAWEALRARVIQWIEPIPGAAPAGAAMKFDPRYEDIAREIEKLDSPLALVVDWPAVTQKTGELLNGATKDLALAAYLSMGLYSTRGLPGLGMGMVLLCELSERYWDTMFPELKRLRARGNVMSWFVDRVSLSLPTVTVSGADRAVVQDLSVAARKLASVVRDRFESHGPAMGPLLETVERMLLSLPPEAPPPPPPGATQPAQPSEAGGQQTATAQPAAAASAGTPLAAAAPAAMGEGADATQYLRDVGTSLASAAGTIRRANLADPLGYRVLRVGLWLHLAQEPPSAPGGKTQVPPLSPKVRAQLEAMANNAKWPELIEEAESALVMTRFSLDLHRFTANALGQMGTQYEPARRALLAELAGFVRRLPGLVNLTSQDGTPFADAATRAFLDAELPSGGGAGGGAGAGEGEDDSWIAETRGQAASGKLADAIGTIQEHLSTARSARGRFRARMALAEAASIGGNTRWRARSSRRWSARSRGAASTSGSPRWQRRAWRVSSNVCARWRGRTRLRWSLGRLP